jgi:hypothetical protein
MNCFVLCCERSSPTVDCVTIATAMCAHQNPLSSTNLFRIARLTCSAMVIFRLSGVMSQYYNITVTAAHYEVFFAQHNSFLAFSSQLFCQLPTPETLSILCYNCQVSRCHPFLIIIAELNSRLNHNLELGNSTHFSWKQQPTISILNSSCLRSSLYSFGTAPQKTPLPLLLRVDSLLQRCVRRTVAQQSARYEPQKTPLFYCCSQSLPRECVFLAVVKQRPIPVFRHHVTVIVF